MNTDEGAYLNIPHDCQPVPYVVFRTYRIVRYRVPKQFIRQCTTCNARTTDKTQGRWISMDDERERETPYRQPTDQEIIDDKCRYTL